ALLELRAQLGEFGDLGRADEGEILRIEKDHLPLAGEALLGERLESALAVLFVAVELGLHADDLEVRQGLANAEHGYSSPDLRFRRDGEVRGVGPGDRGRIA